MTNMTKISPIEQKMLDLEEELAKNPKALFGDGVGELKHTFVPGGYIRQITMKKGLLVTSKIHKVEHPYFIMKGECSVLTDDGAIRIKAPYWGITKPRTKRVIYIHEETIWITVHITDSTDLKEIENQLIAPSFKDVLTEDKNRRLT